MVAYAAKFAVKIQRPLFPPNAPWLIYDEKRAFHEYIAGPPEHVAKAMGHDLKGYFEAAVMSGRLVIGKRLPDLEW